MGRVNTNRSSLFAHLGLLLMLTTVLAVVSPAPAQAAVSRDTFENCLLDRVNEARRAAAVGPLQMARDLVPPVREWSEWMRFDGLKHMPDSTRHQILPESWTNWSENIATHSNDDMADCDAIHEMWMNSPDHRANILSDSVDFVAIGTYVDDSGWWATQLFFDATYYTASCDGIFCDDDGSVFEAAIEEIAAAGITQGCNPPSNDRFCPDDPVSRGAMAAFLTRALHLPAATGIHFDDVAGSVFADSIQRIAAADLTRGCNPPHNTRFCPDQFVTRAQMAAFIVRALDLPAAHGVDFVDDDGSAFEADIESIAAAGITTGCNPPLNTAFCPGQFVTRGQMAAFLARALDL